MSWQCDLLSDWSWAAGVVLKHLGPPEVEQSAITECIDARQATAATLVFGREYLPLFQRALVIRTQMEDGEIFEHKIDDVQVSSLESLCTVTAVPIALTLWGHDIVREYSGSRVLTTFEDTGTVAEIITRRVLANIAADGLPWLALGDIEISDTVTVSLDRASRMAALVAILDAAKRGELAFRVSGNQLLIDVRKEITKGVVHVRHGDRLQQYSKTVGFGSFYTGLRAYGEVPPSATDAYDISDNSFLVTSVSGSAPWRVQLIDPTTGLSPIVVDGIFAESSSGVTPACAIVRDNGTVSHVASSRASDGSVVITVSPPAVGEYIRIAAFGGAPLERIVLPSAAEQYGVVIGAAHVPNAGGERNYVPNAGFARGLTDWSAEGEGASIELVARVRANVSGELAETKPASGPLEIEVTGFPPSVTINRGDDVVVSGANIVGDDEVVMLDAAAKAVVPLVDPLDATIPAGTVLVPVGSPELLPRVYADGAGNVATATSLAIRTLANSKLLAVGDILTVTYQHSDSHTVTAVDLEPIDWETSPLWAGEITVDPPFPFDIPADTVVKWRNQSHHPWVNATVTEAYEAGAPQLAVLTTPPEVGAELQYLYYATSVHTTVEAPAWDADKESVVEITPVLPADRPIIGTTIYWARSDASPVGTITLAAAAAEDDDHLTLNGSLWARRVEPNTVFQLPGAVLPCLENSELDASGEGLIAVPLPATTLLAGSTVSVRRNHDWIDVDGGTSVVAIVTASTGTVNPDEPSTSAPCVTHTPVQVQVAEGETCILVARAPLTFVAFDPVREAQQYAHAKIAIVDVDTDEVLAYAVTTPDGFSDAEFDELTAEEQSRLELVRELDEWRPLHVALRCNAVLTTSRRVQVRVMQYAGTAGVGHSSYASCYVRYATMWRQVGSVEAIPYVDGSRASRMVLAAAQLLEANASPHLTYDIVLSDVDHADVIAAGLPDDAAPVPVRAGTRIVLEAENAELRVLQATRTQDRDASSLRLGRRLPNLSTTVAATAVVSVGGDK